MAACADKAVNWPPGVTAMHAQTVAQWPSGGGTGRASPSRTPTSHTHHPLRARLACFRSGRDLLEHAAPAARSPTRAETRRRRPTAHRTPGAGAGRSVRVTETALIQLYDDVRLSERHTPLQAPPSAALRSVIVMSRPRPPLAGASRTRGRSEGARSPCQSWRAHRPACPSAAAAATVVRGCCSGAPR